MKAGNNIEIRELCLMQGKIEGLDFLTVAVPVEDVDQIDGYKLDAVIGSLTMTQWEIKLDPKTNALGLEALRRRTFIEYSGNLEFEMKTSGQVLPPMA